MNNPVLNREFRLLLRNEVLLKRVFYAWGFLAMVLLLVWPEAGVLSSEAQTSRLVFKLFAFGQLSMCLLLAPAITAPLITDEKENERFGMLFASLLTPFDVLLGKWLSSFVVQIIAIMSGLPLLMLTLVLGGVSWLEILQVYLVCALTLLQFGLMGLFLSSIKNKTYDALLQSYAWMLIWVAMTWLPSYLLGDFESFSIPFAILRAMSPFSAMFDIVSPEVLVYIGRLPSEWDIFELWSVDYLVYVLSAISVSVVLFVLCLKKVFDLPLGRDVRSEVKESDAKKRKFPYTLINPDKRRKPFGVGNLMFIKELRCKMFGHIGNLIRGVYVGFSASISLVILVTMNMDSLSMEAVRVVSVLFQLVIILLLCPALTASAIAEEYNLGTMEMIRMTPVSAWKVWSGKLKAAIFYMLILLFSSIPIYSLFVIMEIVSSGNPLLVLEIVAIQIMLLVFASACGIWCSALMQDTQKAVGLSYLILIALMAGPFSLEYFLEPGIVLEWLSSSSSFLVCIRQASMDMFRDVDVFLKHFIVMFVILIILVSHSVVMTSKMMRQAR
jgi:ABC-type transport system involved in multi-copper enzyme maturation permease subunit